MADLWKQLVFPREIVTTTLWPDIVMWSTVEKRVLLIELTIHWEEGMTAAHKRKHLKYSELAAECKEVGWRARVYPVEVRCQGFVGRTAVQLFHGAGVAGSNLRKTIKELVDKGAGAPDKAQRVGDNPSVKGAAGGGRETTPTCHRREMYWYRGAKH